MTTPELPPGTHRLWCVRTANQQCIGAIVTDAEYIAAEGCVLGFPPDVQAVAWIQTVNLGEWIDRTGTDQPHYAQPVVSGHESKGMPCRTEANALEALEIERVRLLAEGWIEVHLDPLGDPD